MTSADPSSADPSSADRYAVLGNPVAHSRSPFIHAEFARQTGQAVEYGRLLCPLDGFAAAVRSFAASGAAGCNVTVPFKTTARRLAGGASERAVLAGAANVLRFGGSSEPARWQADNTDGVGLLRDIQINAGLALVGLRVLLIGAGGAGAGVLGPLIQTQPASVCVHNRTAGKAQALAERHGAWAQQHGVVLRSGGLGSEHGPFDVVINASASSLLGQAVPVPASVLASGALAIDLMYGAPAEPFLAWARAAGAVPRDGLGMLVEQAAEAFYFWRGVRPDTAPVLQALRQHVIGQAPALVNAA